MSGETKVSPDIFYPDRAWLERAIAPGARRRRVALCDPTSTVQMCPVRTTGSPRDRDRPDKTRKKCSDVKLEELLNERGEAIVGRWVELIIASYPADTSAVLRRQKDQILNPVGHTIRTETALLYRALLDGADEAALVDSMDNLIKIRAVQDYAPRQALAFVFLLKTSVRQELHKELTHNGCFRELLEFESRIDGLALLLFDRYMMCKQRIFEIRAIETRMRSAKLIEQVNKLYGEDKLPDDLV
jgi:hypothetical protein